MSAGGWPRSADIHAGVAAAQVVTRYLTGALLGCRWTDLSGLRRTPCGTGPSTRSFVGPVSEFVEAEKPRRRRLLLTKNTDEKAMAAPAISGLSRPRAASGIATAAWTTLWAKARNLG